MTRLKLPGAKLAAKPLQLSLWAIALNLAMIIPSEANAYEYEYKIIGISSTYFRSTGNSINSANQVAWTDFGSRYHAQAYLHQPNGIKIPISSIFPGLSNTSSGGMNDSGRIVGNAYLGYGEICKSVMVGPSSCTRGFSYQNGTATKIPTLGGNYNRASSINNKGQITGSSRRLGNASSHAFLYNPGQLKDLGTLGGTLSVGYGINDNGAVTGASSLVGDILDLPTSPIGYIDGYSVLTHAFVYANNSMQDLGALASGRSSVGVAINNVGQVTGYSGVSKTNTKRAFFYSNGVMKNLGALGGLDSIGIDINNKGQVVEWYTGKNYWGYFRHAFVYRNNKMADLNNLIDPASGWELLSANSINDAGWIVGEAKNNLSLIPAGYSFLAIPCPNSSC